MEVALWIVGNLPQELVEMAGKSFEHQGRCAHGDEGKAR
jgi:hypothetical protein